MTKFDEIPLPAGAAGQWCRLHKPNILAVGTRSEWIANGSGMPEAAGYEMVEFGEFKGGALAVADRATVVSPVVTSGFDCIDVANVLADAGFRGSYRAFSRRLPNPDIVRREVLAHFPGLDFDVVIVGSHDSADF